MAKSKDNKILNEEQRVYVSQIFKEIDFSDEIITQKEFDNCQFIGCNFSDASFIKCKIMECLFKNCNLSMIKVNQSAFFDTVFEESKVIGVNWTNASWGNIKLSSPLKFYKCILNDSSFLGLHLSEIVMAECKAHDIDLRETDCTRANFSHTDFTNSLFNKTILTEADFSESSNYNINLHLNDIKKAKFTLPEAVNLLRCLDIEIMDYV